MCWSCGHSHGPPSYSSPPNPIHPRVSLFLVRSFFPPVLPGIKPSIHAPEETHSGGERKEGGENGWKKREVPSRWDSLWLAGIRPGGQNCACAKRHRTQHVLLQLAPPLLEMWRHLRLTKQLLGKVDGKVCELVTSQNVQSWFKFWLCSSYNHWSRKRLIFEPCFWAPRSLLHVGHDEAFDLRRTHLSDDCKADSKHSGRSGVKSSLIHSQQ